MKKISLGLVFSLGLCWVLIAQSTLISWELNSSQLGNPTVYSSALTGYHFERGNGLSKLTYSASYVQAQNWAAAPVEEHKVDYFEFGVRANADETIELSGLAFKEKRSSDGPRTVVLYYSRDEFQTANLLGTLHLPDDIGVRSHRIPLDITTDARENLRFRLYAYDSESQGGSWAIRSETLRLTGRVEARCPVFNSTSQLTVLQTTQTTLAVGLQGGSRDKLLVVSPATDELAHPYTGKIYRGDPQYGSGDAIAGSTTYVINVSGTSPETVTIGNLVAGERYQLAIFDFEQATHCYAGEPYTLTVTTDCPIAPQEVQRFRYSALDREVGVDWVGPNCLDKYLLVGSKHVFSGLPTTTTLTGVANFGHGSAVPGLGEDVFALYYGEQANREIVKRLENGTDYYFALYTLYDGQWSAGRFFSARPEASCVPQTKERIFLNEVHYLNAGLDQDEGVEVAGAAGIDLSNYRINLYYVPPGTNTLMLFEREVLLHGFIDDEGAGYGAVWFPIPDLPDRRGLMTLTNLVTEEVVFTIYNVSPNRLLTLGGGSIQQLPFERAVGAEGERNTDPPGLSIQLVGTELCPLDLLWSKLPHTRGFLNVSQRLLPVELLSLAAVRAGEHARIYWSTAQEENSDYFILEHSSDGRRFRPLAQVKAAGSSSYRLDYEYYDLSPSPGKNYYRLRQFDFDGTSYDHGLVSVHFSEEDKKWHFAPNPVLNRTTVQWTGPAQELQLVDASGRLLRRLLLTAEAEGGSYSLELMDLPAGVYYLRLIYADQMESRALLKH